MSWSRSALVLSVASACAVAVTAQAPAESVRAAPLSFTNKVINSDSVNDPGADTTAQDTQSETSVAANGSNVVVGFNDSGSFLGGASKFTGFSNSTNSGGSFTDRGTLPTNANGDGGDPNLAINSQTDDVFMSTLGFNSFDAIEVFKSTDGGASFGAPVNGIPGGIDLDKDWLTVDNFPGARRGTLYLCATDFGFVPQHTVVTHSTDNGVNWGPSGGVLVSGGASQGCTLAVGPDHSVYAAYFRGGSPNQLFIRRSTDGGVTFGTEHPVATLSTSATNGDLNLGGGFRTNSFPQMAVNPLSGAVVVVYNDDDVSGNTDNGNIFYAESTDNGVTWSTPAKVNDDGPGDQFMPALAISPTGEQVAFGYYSRSHDPANRMFHRRIRLATMNTTTAAIHMRPSAQISPDTPVAIGQDPVVNSLYMGYYDQIAATSASFYSTWADNRSGDSFHEFQPDVQIARVARTAPNTPTDVGVTVTPHPATFDEGDTTRLAVTVTAHGAPARDVYLSVDPGKDLTVNSAAGCDVINGIASCSLGKLGAGASKTRSVFATGLAGHRTAHARVTTTDDDTSNANNAAAPALTVNPPPGTIQTFSTGNLAVPIPDNSTVNVPINVGPAGNVLDIDAVVRLNHTLDADLDMFLVSPGRETTVELSTDNGLSGGYGAGANDCSGSGTRFNDAAPTSITTGSAPFSGQFKPEGLLSDLNGLDESGLWTLQVTDDAAVDTGTIGCAKLIIRRP